MSNTEYWQTYEYVKKIYCRRGVFNEGDIHKKVIDIINRKKADLDEQKKREAF
jgi:hypothetical protein